MNSSSVMISYHCIDNTLMRRKRKVNKFLNIFKRGLARICPSCGKSKMFTGYLKPATTPCPHCQLDFQTIRSDDIPAYFTVFLVGHLVLPLILIVEQKTPLSLIANFFIWLPLTIGLVLGFLPFVKGAVMAVIWWSRQK